MKKFLLPLLLATISAALSSCASSGKSYYMLNAEGAAPSGGGSAIGIGPVAIAEYLDRENLVTQTDSNTLAVSEDNRWAGDLATSITRVTGTNLGRRLRTGNFRTYPWQGDEGLSSQVTLDIRQFHGTADGHAVLEAGWRVYSLPERKLKISRTFTGREPLASDGYQALVAAQSRLLARMADQIAAKMR